MEDLFDFMIQNAREYSHAAAGFGAGAATTYLAKLNMQRKGEEIFSEEEEDWYRHILEEDPMYNDEGFSEGKLMDIYYDNFEVFNKNVHQGFHSAVSTVLLDGFETVSFDSNFIGLQDYPQMAAGFYAGMKAAEHTPTPMDAAEAYRNFFHNDETLESPEEEL